MAFETTICQECPTPIQWPSLRAAYLRCINIALDTRDAMLKDRDARIAALEAQVKTLTAERDAQAEAVRNAGCFFCRDCDAVRCEEGVASKLRKIAEQSGKRNWWNVVIYVIELHRMVLDAMRRDMNNPIAAAAVKGGTHGT